MRGGGRREERDRAEGRGGNQRDPAGGGHRPRGAGRALRRGPA